MSRTFREPRYADRLVAIDELSQPFLRALDAAGGEVADSVRTVPADAVAAVRIALLRRVVESELETAESTNGRRRAVLAARGIRLQARDAALEIALARFGADLGAGVVLGAMRTTLFDPTLVDLERLDVAEVTPELIAEVEGAVALLATETMTMDARATDRRFRMVAFLARAAGSRLPALALDSADPFGRAMRALIATDEDLAESLAMLLPIAQAATTPLPDRPGRARIAAIAASESTIAGLRDAISRTVRQLMVAPLVPRGPGFVTVRPANQRLARAVLWVLPQVLPVAAPGLLADVGIRMGTSGRRDNQARDQALATTCAALLGELGGEAAVVGLARMRSHVRNRPVAKQVQKALTGLAAASGQDVEAMVDACMPSFGVDRSGRVDIAMGSWTIVVKVGANGDVGASWFDPAGSEHQRPPDDLREQSPAEAATLEELLRDIRSSLAHERRRLEALLVDDRAIPLAEWRHRYLDHPLRAIHARRLIWRLDGQETTSAIPLADQLIGRDEGPVDPPARTEVVLWHPVDSSPEELEGWRDFLLRHRIAQPFGQAFRETYRAGEAAPAAGPAAADALIETRFADRPLAYGQLRALLGERGWSAPMPGPFDQGDSSVAVREFERYRVRAEFGVVPAGLGDPRESVVYARSRTVRFLTTGPEHTPILLRSVPRRLFSEVLRDVDLFTSVPDPMRSPAFGPSVAGTASGVVATRINVLRRLLPTLPLRNHLAIVGIWLRVQAGDRTWAISLADGSVLQLPDEQPVAVDGPSDIEDGELPYLPTDDPFLARVLVTASRLTAASER